MTGLSPGEVDQVTELLELLTDADLIELAHTTTTGLISCRDRQDAIRTITQHSTDVRTLLNRKKITKSLLFSYLHDKEVVLASATDKNSLIETTLKFWNRTLTSPANQSSSITPPSDVLTEELSIKFASWFYDRLNDPVLRQGDDTLISTDFWNDAQTIVRLLAEGGQDGDEMSASSDVECVALFDNLHREHGLVYALNSSGSGVRGKSEPHGAVMIMACGTLHRGANQCVGVFEQTFVIIKDPISANWKIKRTLLVLRSKFKVESMPTLSLTD